MVVARRLKGTSLIGSDSIYTKCAVGKKVALLPRVYQHARKGHLPRVSQVQRAANFRRLFGFVGSL